MTAKLNNTRRARPNRAQALRLAAALVALAFLAGAGAALALGQATSTARFIPAATSGISEPDEATPPGTKPLLTAHPLDDTNTTATPPPFGNYMGTSPMNGTSVQQQVYFVTNSTSASYVPTVSLQYGISYSAGPVSCVQTIVPTNNNPLVPVPYVQTCSVTVSFAPLYPGGHRDALYILDDGGGHLAGVFLYGIGQAPQLMIQPGVPTSVTLPGHLYGATTDEAGTYYVYANNDFYTVKENGVYTQLASSVPSTSSLSADGAGDLFEPGPYPSNYSGWEYGGDNDITLCYTAPGLLNQNPQILATSVCFYSPVTVTTGNLGTYYDADGGGETQEYDGSTIQYTKGLLLQTYAPQGVVRSPTAPTEINGISYPAYGRQPLPYPILSGNYGPNGMVVDPYENVFFTDPNNGLAVWCDMSAYSPVGISSAITDSSNGCGGWGTSMVLLNQYIGTNPNLAVDAADTLYAGQGGIQMFSAANNYASAITGIGGYGSAPSLAPDGTLYVENGSTLNIVNRFQGSINWLSNNGQVSAQQTVTLYNGGNQPLTISSIVPSGGAGYTVGPATSNGCATNGITLAPGTICQFLVTSTVPHAGTLTGSVAITSNSLNQPGTVQQVALTGYTSGIWVAATPNPYVFPAQTAGTTSVPLPVTVTNTSVGSNAVGYGSTVAITSGFTSSNPAFTASLGNPSAPTYCGNPLPAGSTCLIQVTFNPTAATNYSGTISWYEQITGGGPSMKVSFAISGNGVPVPLLVPISETVHFTDSDVVTPSLLIPISEAVHIADSDVPVPSLLIPISETVHVTDTVPNLGTPVPPFGHIDSAVDSVTASSTVGQSHSVVVKGWVGDQIDGAPLSNVKVYIDGSLAGTPTLGIARPDVAAVEGAAYLDSGYTLTHSVAALSLGSHAVTVIAIDSGGRSKTLGPLTFTVAATAGAAPPFGHLDSAVDSVTASNTVGQSDSVVVKGWIADQIDGAPLSNVKVYIDGNLVGTPTLGIARPDVAAVEGAAYLNSGYTLTYSAATLSLGSHVVAVIAIDSGARSTTFGPLDFTVAATAGAAPPTPPFGHLDDAVDSVTASSTVGQSHSVVVKGWAADLIDGAPLSNVKVYIDENLAGTPTLDVARPDVAGANRGSYLNSGYTLTYSVAALSLGSHDVTVIAVDSGGRSTTFGPLDFTVAATAGAAPPTPPFGHLDDAVDSVTASSTVAQSHSVVVKGWAADLNDGSPLSNVKVYIDGNLAGTPTLGIARPDVAAAEGAANLDSGYTLTYSVAALSLGSHAVTVIAIDSGGRSTTFGPLDFTVQ